MTDPVAVTRTKNDIRIAQTRITFSWALFRRAKSSPAFQHADREFRIVCHSSEQFVRI